MAFAIEDLVVSPGINAGSPFALGDVLYVAQVSPAIAASTPVIQINTATSPQQVQIGPFATIPGATVIGSGAVVPTGGAGNEVVIGTNASTGLDTQDSIAIGHGATTGILNSANGGVALGVGATVGGAGSNAGGGVAVGETATANNGVAIGAAAVCLLGQVAIGSGSLAQNFGVAVGGGAAAFIGAAHGNGSVAIGRNASAGESTDIAIGTGNGGTLGGEGGNVMLGSGVGSAGVTGHDCVCVGSSSNSGGGFTAAASSGNFSTVIGGNSTAAHIGVHIFGRGITSTANNQCVIGGTDDPVATVYVGNGITNTGPQNVILGVTGASGANVGGAQLTIAGGISTGTGLGGPILFQTTPAGLAGSSPNALTTALTIDSTQLVTFANAPFLTTQSAPGVANAGTLTNLPAAAAAGNPQVYLQLKSTGHTYVVPAWQVA